MERFLGLVRQLFAWPWLPIGILTVGLALTGVPEELEGADVLTLDQEGGHGFTVSNIVALLLVLAGLGPLLLGFRQRSKQLFTSWQHHRFSIGLLGSQLCVGVALMLQSGVSTALVWWGPGVVIFILALAGLAAFALPPRTS
ncbi:MAG TPA: hypothetical protein VFS30_06405 [Dehalococcoidia bacterium]|nr:hypothetical protein [Dehalococcoidia bacterium]